jgi:hypothetical protein
VKYSVTLSFEVESGSPVEATADTYQRLCELVANPCTGANVVVVTEQGNTGGTTGERVALDEALLATQPLRLAQILGFRHFIWTSGR